MVIRAFITHKKAEVFADCQDRFGVNNDTKSIAVSDGMGSTWQQKIWAQLLVDTFTESKDWLPNADSIKPLCSTWKEKVENFIQQLKETNAPKYLTIMNERSLYLLRRSAGATFVGIRFNGKEWSGSVLGDSCLIEWDGNETMFYSSQDVDTFDSYPDYFDSDVSKEGKGTPKPIKGILSGGKCLLLVSDPFSDFLLEHKKQSNEGEYISQLLAVSSHEDFETLVAKWREEGMHNDDTTLVVVENDGTDEFSIVALDDLDTLIEKDKLEKEKKQEINIDEQIVFQKEQGKEESETPTDSNCTPTPVETNLIIKELINELERYRNSLEKKRLRNWWSLIKKAIKEVLSRYVIYKK